MGARFLVHASARVRAPIAAMVLTLLASWLPLGAMVSPVESDGSGYSSASVPSLIVAGGSVQATVTMTNNGTTTWGSGYTLGYGGDAHLTVTMLSASLSSVAPGQSVTYTVSIQASSILGTYVAWWQMRDGSTFFGAHTPNWPIRVLAAYDAAYVSQTTLPSVMTVGQTLSVQLVMTNTGTATWEPAGTGMCAFAAQDPAASTTWGLGSMPLGGAVATDQNAVFAATITAPSTIGTYVFQWQMRGPPGFFGALTPVQTIQVLPACNAAYVSQSGTPSTIAGGTSFSANVTMTNTGADTWPAGMLATCQLASDDPNDNATWGVSRIDPAAAVASGAQAVFTVSAVAPMTPGSYHFQWQMNGPGGRFGAATPDVVITVTSPYNAAYMSQSGVPATIAGGASFTATITMTNTGGVTWPAGLLASCQLASADPNDNTIWGASRLDPAAATAPGANAAFTLNGIAPTTPGSYHFQWQMNGPSGRFGAATPDVVITVTSPYNAAYVSQSGVPATIAGGASFTATIIMTNTGGVTWQAGLLASCQLASADPNDNTTWGASRLDPAAATAPGANAAFTLNGIAPMTPGSYHFQWQMNGPSGRFGAATPDVVITVTSPYSAGYVSQGGIPITVVAGGSFTPSITMSNLGGVAWGAGLMATCMLGSQDTANNATWGATRMYASTSAAPGQQATFSATCVAPSTPGTYQFQWQMIGPAGSFGALTPVTTITVQAAYGAAFVSQSLPAQVVTGSSFTVSITMKNTGGDAWQPGSVSLGSQDPAGNGTWGVSTLALATPVAPGAQATIAGTLTAPSTPGSYACQWQLRGPSGSFGALSTAVQIAVVAPYDASFVSQSMPATIAAGARFNASITMANTGADTWQPSSVSLGAQDPAGNRTWGTSSVPLAAAVAPGHQAVITAPLTAPSVPGTYTCQWQLRGPSGSFGAMSSAVQIAVLADYDATCVSQSLPSTAVAGATMPVSITMRNTGGDSWPATSVSLGSASPAGNTTWGTSRIALAAAVAPNQQASFAATLRVPATPGNYLCQWQMSGPPGPFGAYTAGTYVTVLPAYAASLVSQSVPSTVVAGSHLSASFTFANTGGNAWQPSSVSLGSQGPAGNTIWGTDSVGLAAAVPPNQQATIGAALTAPAMPGTYSCMWQLRSPAGGFGPVTNPVQVTVIAAYDAAFVSQSVPASVMAGASFTASFTFDNTGGDGWQPGTVSLGSQDPAANTIWGASSVALPAAVPPNQQATITAHLTAPTAPGSYALQWQLQGPHGSFGSATTLVNVAALAPNNASCLAQSVPATMYAGEAYPVAVEMVNSVAVTWTSAASYRLGSQAPAGNATWGLSTIALTGSVATNQVASFTFTVTAPRTVGTYAFQWRMQHGGAWFGSPSASVTVSVVPPPLAIQTATLPLATSGRPYDAPLQAIGGVPPYAWDLTWGDLPAGLSLDPASGRIAGTPSAVGMAECVVAVHDAAGSSASAYYALSVYPPYLEIITPAIEELGTNTSWIQGASIPPVTMQAAGGIAPYAWSISAGALPAGVSLSDASGDIAGTPTVAGIYPVEIRVTDATGATATCGYVLQVWSPTGISVITSTQPNESVVGRSYSVTFTASGGRPPYCWSLFDTALTPGLALDQRTGVLSGTLLQKGSFGGWVQATDADGRMGFGGYGVYVHDGMWVEPAALDDVSLYELFPPWGCQFLGGSYLPGFTSSWSGLPPDGAGGPYPGGPPPNGYMIPGSSGSCSSSMLVFASGYGGSDAGDYTIHVEAKDALGETAAKDYPVTVHGGGFLSQEFFFRTKALDPMALGYTAARPIDDSYSFDLIGQTVSVSGGSLPPGVKVLNPLGDGFWLFGTPTQAGSFTFTLKATTVDLDGTEHEAERTFTEEVLPTPPLFIGAAQLADAPIGQSYSAAAGVNDQPYLSSFGYLIGSLGPWGNAPILKPALTWKVAGGRLPPGLSLKVDDQTYVPGYSSPFAWIMGTPTTSGVYTFTLEVDDDHGQSNHRTCQITVPDGRPRITTDTMPSDTVSTPYMCQMHAAGGVAPLTWSAIGLPQGLALNASTGLISGSIARSDPEYGGQVMNDEVYDLANEYSVQVTVTDADGVDDTAVLPLMADDDRLAFSGEDRLDLVAMVPGGMQLAAAGGSPPYSFSVLPGADSIPGMAVTPGGFIYGKPYQPGHYLLPVMVTDAEDDYRLRTVAVEVAPPPCALQRMALPSGMLGTPYGAQTFAVGAFQPFTYKVVSGSLPPGLSFSANGVLSGTPSTFGSYGFTVLVTDANGTTDSQSYYIAVDDPDGAPPSSVGRLESLGSPGLEALAYTEHGHEAPSRAP